MIPIRSETATPIRTSPTSNAIILPMQQLYHIFLRNNSVLQHFTERNLRFFTFNVALQQKKTAKQKVRACRPFVLSLGHVFQFAFAFAKHLLYLRHFGQCHAGNNAQCHTDNQLFHIFLLRYACSMRTAEKIMQSQKKNTRYAIDKRTALL